MSGALLTRPPATTTSVTGTSPKARAPHERGLLARSGLVAARRRVPQVADRGLGLAPGLALTQVAQHVPGGVARLAHRLAVPQVTQGFPGLAAGLALTQVAQGGFGLAAGLTLAQVPERGFGLAARLAGAHVLQRGPGLAGRVAVLGSAQPRDQPGPQAPNMLLVFGHRGLSFALRAIRARRSRQQTRYNVIPALANCLT